MLESQAKETTTATTQQNKVQQQPAVTVTATPSAAVASTTAQSVPATPAAAREEPVDTGAVVVAVAQPDEVVVDVVTPNPGKDSARVMPVSPPVAPKELQLPTSPASGEASGTITASSPLSPAHEKANAALRIAQMAMQAAATTTALAKQAREREQLAAGPLGSPQTVSPRKELTFAADKPPVASSTEAIPTDTANLQRPLSKKPTDEGFDEEDEEFVLMPVVRSEFPDAWVPVTQNNETYYVNYARNQSNWTIPPGY